MVDTLLEFADVSNDIIFKFSAQKGGYAIYFEL